MTFTSPNTFIPGQPDFAARLNENFAAVDGMYVGGATGATRDTLAALTNANPFTFGMAGVAQTADTTHNFVGGFFGVDVDTPGTGKAHVALQAVARNTVLGGNAWGFNALVQTNQDHTTGLGVWSAEFDVNFNGATSSGGLWATAQNVKGLSVASGGTKRPLAGVSVEHQYGAGQWVYGIRFAAAYNGSLYESAVWDSGADIVSEAQSLTHTLWEAHLLHNAQPAYQLRADGRVFFGDGSAAVDTNAPYRAAAGQLDTGTTTFQAWQVYSANSVEARGSGGNGYLQLGEQSAAPAGVADIARVFARDNGAGKTQLCVQFATGAVQVVSTQP